MERFCSIQCNPLDLSSSSFSAVAAAIFCIVGMQRRKQRPCRDRGRWRAPSRYISGRSSRGEDRQKKGKSRKSARQRRRIRKRQSPPKSRRRSRTKAISPNSQKKSSAEPSRSSQTTTRLSTTATAPTGGRHRRRHWPMKWTCKYSSLNFVSSEYFEPKTLSRSRIASLRVRIYLWKCFSLFRIEPTQKVSKQTREERKGEH